MDFIRVGIAAVMGALGGGLGALVVVAQRARSRASTSASPDVAAPTGPKLTQTQQLVVLVPAVALGVLTSVLHWDLAIEEKLFPTIAYQNAADRRMKPLLDDPKYQALANGRTPEQMADVMLQLTAKGLPRLSTPDLMQIGKFRRLLSETSPAVCAQLWSGRGDPSAITKAVATLPRDEIDAFTELSVKSAKLQLDGVTDYPSNAPMPPVQEVVRAVEVALGPRAGEFDAIVQKGSTATPAEGCRALLMMFDALPKMPEADARSALTLFAR